MKSLAEINSVIRSSGASELESAVASTRLQSFITCVFMLTVDCLSVYTFSRSIPEGNSLPATSPSAAAIAMVNICNAAWITQFVPPSISHNDPMGPQALPEFPSLTMVRTMAGYISLMLIMATKPGNAENYNTYLNRRITAIEAKFGINLPKFGVNQAFTRIVD